jgi:hypothetical protein
VAGGRDGMEASRIMHGYVGRRSTLTHTVVWWQRLRPYRTHGRTEVLVGSSGRAHAFHASSSPPRQHSRSGDGHVAELNQSRLVLSIWHGSTRPCTRQTSASAPPIDSCPREIGIVDSMSDESDGGWRSHPIAFPASRPHIPTPSDSPQRAHAYNSFHSAPPCHSPSHSLLSLPHSPPLATPFTMPPINVQRFMRRTEVRQADSLSDARRFASGPWSSAPPP